MYVLKFFISLLEAEQLCEGLKVVRSFRLRCGAWRLYRWINNELSISPSNDLCSSNCIFFHDWMLQFFQPKISNLRQFMIFYPHLKPSASYQLSSHAFNFYILWKSIKISHVKCDFYSLTFNVPLMRISLNVKRWRHDVCNKFFSTKILI